jgi:AraC-like DNA-binding protein
MTALAELGTLITRHSRGPALPGIMMSATHVPTQPMGSVAKPAFALVAGGQKRSILGDNIYTYGAGEYLVISAELPFTGHISKASRKDPFLGFGLALEPTAIATLLLETGSTDRSAATTPSLAVSRVTPDLLDAVVRLLRLLDRPRDLPVLVPMVTREILWLLMNGEQGALVRQIGLADSRLAQIARVLTRIRSHYAEALRIEDLTKLARMSASSFHRHFRAVTAMTPIQYQKQIRLQQARAQLIAGPRDIAAVGRAVGYASPSQFNREYRRMFGSTPGSGKSSSNLRAS